MHLSSAFHFLSATFYKKGKKKKNMMYLPTTTTTGPDYNTKLYHAEVLSLITCIYPTFGTLDIFGSVRKLYKQCKSRCGSLDLLFLVDRRYCLSLPDTEGPKPRRHQILLSKVWVVKHSENTWQTMDSVRDYWKNKVINPPDRYLTSSRQNYFTYLNHTCFISNMYDRWRTSSHQFSGLITVC